MITRTFVRTLAALLTLAPVGCDDKQPDPDNKTGDADADPEADPETDPEADPEEGGPYDMSTWPDPAVGCPDSEPRECKTADDKDGLSHCVVVDAKQVWSECRADDDWEGCVPGESWDMGCIGSYCAFDGKQLYLFDWQSEPMCETPLVLRFDDAPLRFAASADTRFDFAAAEPTGCATDWPSAPWLALDRDRSGSIDSGRELFGSGTLLGTGRRAAHGFEALAELDADHDGRVTPADPRFAELVLWSDHDADRSGALAELAPVASHGLIAIHLDYQRRGECDERGNCGLERAAFEYRDASGQPRIGEIVDVYLACQ